MIQGRGRGVERGELKFQNPLQTFISLRILSLEGYSPSPHHPLQGRPVGFRRNERYNWKSGHLFDKKADHLDVYISVNCFVVI